MRVKGFQQRYQTPFRGETRANELESFNTRMIPQENGFPLAISGFRMYGIMEAGPQGNSGKRFVSGSRDGYAKRKNETKSSDCFREKHPRRIVPRVHSSGTSDRDRDSRDSDRIASARAVVIASPCPPGPVHQ